jgi:8-oxo-dGTP pyrophosphatase MutT (NUDIX family)
MDDPNPWKKLSSKIVYKNPWIKIYEDEVIKPDGSRGIYGYMDSRDSVVIVALNEKHEVYVIQGFSYPASKWAWILPGGGGDNEDPLTASKRELLEETGITAEHWGLLGETRVCNGLMSERMAVVLARGLTWNKRPEADDAGLISNGKFVSFDEIDKMIKRNEIDDSQTMTGLYLVQRWLAVQ